MPTTGDLKEMVVRYIDYIRSVRGYSPLTVRHYELVLNEAARYWEIEEREEGVLLSLMPWRIAIANQARATIARKVSTVRSFVAWLNEEGMVVMLKGGELAKQRRNLPRPLPLGVIQEAFKRAEGVYQVAIALLFGCGLRISELANVKITDLRHGWIEVTGKGNKRRQVPMPSSVALMVQEYIKTTSPRLYLFEEQGKMMGSAKIRRRLQKLFASLGVKMTPHQLRHSFATSLLAEGARINDVSTLLGHAHLATTQIYTALGMQTTMEHYKLAHPLCGKKVR